MKVIVWISYDLGVNGDYEGMYRWLDGREARECGDSLAFMNYEYSNNDLPGIIKNDIKNNVAITKKSRIYLVYRDELT